MTIPLQTSDQEYRKPLPRLPPEIWLEIFQFSTYTYHSIAPIDPFTQKRISNNVMGPNTPLLAQQTKRNLVLVCQSWRQIATQILYHHIVVLSPSRATMILHALEKHSYALEVTNDKSKVRVRISEYGRYVRHLEIHTHSRRAESPRYLETLSRIFQYCPNLRILDGTWNHPLPVEFITAVTKLYGATLRELYWQDQKDTSVVTPTHLACFQALRVLDLRDYSGCDTNVSYAEGPTLPLVDHLILSTRATCLTVATELQFPRLTKLTLRTPATEPVDSDLAITTSSIQVARTLAHVKPALFLKSGVCPNLDTLTFAVTAPIITLADPHPTLRRIGLRDVRVDGLYPDKNCNTKSHLTSFNRNMFPNLETVRTVGFLVEAETDAMVEDVFIWWSERFESDGIDFQDGQGVVWAYEEESDSES
ncbi:uncharacterized protein EV420DRAFT_1525958 [Desarmillaria tabescens]|uniref:F-box domain-containing protein n=1 Tax=Armillaria tabescens TaxID=1929756 RepID=A0AA39NBM7_ARMTA|nr:uncharacterized protein EV420DRAFT_1525958 [Desarmillaria tabescens]KAK0462624.1 hypothetical protein EV420DRAFT_1525958 [Desarmillaria tabescens]